MWIILWTVLVDFLAAVKVALKTGKQMKQAAWLGDSQLSVGSEAIWMRRRLG